MPIHLFGILTFLRMPQVVFLLMKSSTQVLPHKTILTKPGFPTTIQLPTLRSAHLPILIQFPLTEKIPFSLKKTNIYFLNYYYFLN